ncbi:MAG TPA: serine hydrolase domain-containing protein [Pyrinomonadaceae bacterium]|nr:serine hydrolase domain-containing protein [Pyrinomonadaceae bacterium]
MNRRNFVSLMGAAGVVSITNRHAPAVPRSNTPDVARMLEVTRVPGVAIAGQLDGKPFRLVGGRVSADGPPVTVQTHFPAASLSKPVFAWAIRDLVRQGKLVLDRPLEEYLKLGLDGDARKITAAHVLTHSTGLPNWRFQPGSALASEFQPGSRWQYSGEGYVLLQRVVEKIVNEPIARYMKTTVLTPLAMTDSSFAWTPEIQKSAALGHTRRGELLEQSAAFYERRNYETIQKSGGNPESMTYEQITAAYAQNKVPALAVAIAPNMAGSLQTTIADYAKFLSRVLREFAAKPDDFKSRVDVNRDIGWTLGWGVDRSPKTPALFHWGDSPGFKNFCWIQPSRKTALVFFTNADSGAALYAWLFRQLMNEDPSVFYWI